MTLRSPSARSASLAAPLAAALAFAATLAAAPDAAAQCALPDGLDTGLCCSPSTWSMPTALPGFTLPSTGICWTSCAVSGQTCTTVQVGAPVPAGCTQYVAPLSVLDCGGLVLMKGQLVLDYTRTWDEFPVPGAVPSQVWRFTAKVDLAAPSSTSPGCPVPSCATTPGATAFYYGYVDWVRDCSTSSWSNVLVLHHACDVFVHTAAYSAVPGNFHPNTAFALVAPQTAGNPFVPVDLAPPSGPFQQVEGLRDAQTFTPGVCMAEEPLVGGQYVNLVQGCLCPLALTPTHQAGSRLQAFGACGSGAQSLNLWPIAPWYEVVSTSIGSWSNSSSYPGPEHAAVAEGLFLYTDACDPSGTTVQSFDVAYGALTQGGFLMGATTAGLPLTDRLLDLATNYSIPVSVPIAFPIFGKVGGTTHLVYDNL